MEVSLSILTIDYTKVKEQLMPLSKELKYLHLDVMDGHFVPNISFGPAFIQSLRKEFSLFFDTHLMMTHPKQYIEAFAKAGSDAITFHIEVEDDPMELIQQIHGYGIKAGVAINPKTDIKKLASILPHVDLVLVMSVQPGFGGQGFMRDSIHRVKSLFEEKKKNNYTYLISIDGGISNQTLPLVSSYVDLAVSGSYVMNAASPMDNLRNLKNIL